MPIDTTARRAARTAKNDDLTEDFVIWLEDEGTKMTFDEYEAFLENLRTLSKNSDAKAIAAGTAGLGTTSSITPVAALGGTSGASTPPTGVIDHFKLGQDLTTILAGAGHADPNVGLAFIRSLLQEATTMQTVGQPDKAKKLLAALAFVANRVQHGDVEDDGTLKVFAAYTAAKHERDAAVSAKTTAETKVTTLETKVSGLEATLAGVKTAWETAKSKLTVAFDGDKFKRGAPVPVAELKAVTDAF